METKIRHIILPIELYMRMLNRVTQTSVQKVRVMRGRVDDRVS